MSRSTLAYYLHAAWLLMASPVLAEPTGRVICNIAENAAVMDQKVVAVFSLEMSRESLVLRMLCSQSRVDSHKLRTGFLSREDFGKLQSGLEALAVAGTVSRERVV